MSGNFPPAPPGSPPGSPASESNYFGITPRELTAQERVNLFTRRRGGEGSFVEIQGARNAAAIANINRMLWEDPAIPTPSLEPKPPIVKGRGPLPNRPDSSTITLKRRIQNILDSGKESDKDIRLQKTSDNTYTMMSEIFGSGTVRVDGDKTTLTRPGQNTMILTGGRRSLSRSRKQKHRRSRARQSKRRRQ
jgi:hypothetical protein